MDRGHLPGKDPQVPCLKAAYRIPGRFVGTTVGSYSTSTYAMVDREVKNVLDLFKVPHLFYN